MEAASLAELSSQSRVYDLFLYISEGVTPQEFKLAGRGLEISYGYHVTPFGMCFIVAPPEEGFVICTLSMRSGSLMNLNALSVNGLLPY